MVCCLASRCLAEQRHHVQARIGLLAGDAIDRHLERALDEPLLQVPCVGIGELQLDPGVMPLDRSDQVDDLIRSDRAHDAQLERALLKAGEIFRQAFRLMRLVVDLLEMRLHHRAEFGEVGVRPLAMEQ